MNLDETYILDNAREIIENRNTEIRFELKEAGVPNPDSWELDANHYHTNASYSFKSAAGFTYEFRYLGVGYNQKPSFEFRHIDKAGKTVLRKFAGDWQYMILVASEQLEMDKNFQDTASGWIKNVDPA